MEGLGPPAHSPAWLGRPQGWEPTAWHRPGQLSVAEVAGQGLELGLDGQRGLHRRSNGNSAAPRQATATMLLWKTVLKGYVAHMAKEPKGTHPPGPQVWAATTPSWPGDSLQ